MQERCGGGMEAEKVTLCECVYYELRNLHFLSHEANKGVKSHKSIDGLVSLLGPVDKH